MGFLNLTYIFFFNPLFQIILVWKKGGRKKMRLLDCRKYNLDSVKVASVQKMAECLLQHFGLHQDF